MRYLLDTHASIIAILLALAFLAWRANPKRTSNRHFVLLTLMMGLWVSSLLVGFGYARAENWVILERYVRIASVLGASLLLFSNLLRLAEIIFYRNEREGLNLRLGCSRFQHNDEARGAILVLHDLTRLRQLEMQVRYSDRLASVGTLAAGMAHEIKNPLVAISTFSQLLPEQYDDPEFRDSFTELVNAEVNRIDKLVNDVLKFGQPSKPVFVEIPLHDQLQRLLLLVKVELRKKDISLVSHLAAENDVVRADPDQIQQATLNLLLNAIDAMEPGGCLKLTTDSASCKDGRPGIRILVSDDGPGISEDIKAHIFDPFYTTKPEGTGLGLAITHGIVQEHDGDIAVKSQPGSGTTFCITLPLGESA
jgi:two-component system sensor histidine kinase AtoS